MDMNFQQKSLWLLFASLALAFAVYFAQVLPARTINVMPWQVMLFAVMVVLLVVAQVVGHALIAAWDRRAGADERDRLFALKGARNGGLVLATGVFAALCAALLIEGNFLFTHVLLAAWVLAQLTEIGSQLLLYGRGGA